ncbi:MAG: hypothetical protein ACOYZ8_05820 [Chloroflexota bacterium]
MKSNRLVVLAISVATVVGFACSGLGLPSDPIPTPFPPEYIPTVIAMTAGAANPSVPAAEGTLVPTAPASGTEYRLNEDGTASFMDYDAGFEITSAPGWAGVRPQSEEFEALLSGQAQQNADLLNALQIAQELDPNSFRFMMYDLKPEHATPGGMTNIVVVWDRATTTSVNNYLGVLIQDLETNGAYPGLRITTSNIITNPNGVVIGVLGGRYFVTTDAGEEIPLYLEMAIFNSKQPGMVGVILVTLESMLDPVAPDFDAMVGNIKVHP